jgi:hypothetical protein
MLINLTHPPRHKIAIPWQAAPSLAKIKRDEIPLFVREEFRVSYFSKSRFVCH